MTANGSGRALRKGGVVFRERSDVSDHEQMDAMNNRVGPPAPVFRGPQAVPVPSGCLEQGVAVRQWYQAELAMFGNQVSIQMFGRQFAVRAPFAQRGRILVDWLLDVTTGRVPEPLSEA